MKILYHHRTLGDGAEGIHIKEMICAFTGNGHNVYTAGPVRKIGTENPDRRFVFLKKLLHKLHVYEVFEMLYTVYGYLMLDRKIRRCRPDLIFDRYMIYNVACILAGKKHGIPVITEVNAPLAFERSHEKDETLVFQKIAFKLESWILRQSHLVLAVSSPLKHYLITIGVPGKKIFVLPNGVNHETFLPTVKSAGLMGRIGIPKQAFIIGFSGILRNWHGIDLLIQAVARIKLQVPNAFLLLVGDGEIKQELAASASNFGLTGSFCITGRVPHDSMAEYISLFDVAVSPKTTFYASPMKIPEYMAMGKIVVAPDTENIRDMICNKETGMLFQPGSADSMAETILSIYHNPETKQMIENKALEKVSTTMNWKENANALIKKIMVHKNT